MASDRFPLFAFIDFGLMDSTNTTCHRQFYCNTVYAYPFEEKAIIPHSVVLQCNCGTEHENESKKRDNFYFDDAKNED